MNEISILLSTFNGEKFIKELLNSVLNQTINNFKIFVRDDGSTDQTPNLINAFKIKYPDVFIILNDEKGNLGPRDSFFELLKQAEGSYFLYCDQDDVWLPDKVEKLTTKIKEIEVENPNMPALVFSDMSVINETGELIYNSYFDVANYKKIYIQNILFRGFIPGCSTIFNKHAKKLVLFYYELITSEDRKYLHDGFTFFIINIFGIITFTPEILLKYRLHQGNTVGFGKKSKKFLLIKDLIKYSFRQKAYRRIILRNYYSQVKFLRLPENNQFLKGKELFLEEEVENLHFFKRKKWYLKHFIPFDRGYFEGIINLLLI